MPIDPIFIIIIAVIICIVGIFTACVIIWVLPNCQFKSRDEYDVREARLSNADKIKLLRTQFPIDLNSYSDKEVLGLFYNSEWGKLLLKKSDRLREATGTPMTIKQIKYLCERNICPRLLGPNERDCTICNNREGCSFKEKG